MTDYVTEQEKFWAGEFGNEYISRNQSDGLIASNISFFSKALKGAHPLGSCIEFGANVGMNLKALRALYPNMHLHAIEINARAANQLAAFIKEENVLRGSILDVDAPICDLALIKGVLIHINPEMLPKAYSKLVAATSRWLLISEYYNPTPVSIPYRGHTEKLFKRDFGGEILNMFPEMRLVDYGFVYCGDPQFPQDDTTWFLMEKVLESKK